MKETRKVVASNYAAEIVFVSILNISILCNAKNSEISILYENVNVFMSKVIYFLIQQSDRNSYMPHSSSLDFFGFET
jgi:hypothetical protein